MSRRRRNVVLAVTVAGIMLAVTSVTIAAASQLQRPNGSSRGSSLTVSAGSHDAVHVATNPSDFTTTSLTPVLIPGMSITFTVRHRARVIMHFTDEAGCLSTTSQHWCAAMILVDGVEASPGTGTDDAIDTSDGSGAYRWVGAAINRVAVVAKGTHTVTVVGQPVFAGDTFWSGENDLEVWVF